MHKNISVLILFLLATPVFSSVASQQSYVPASIKDSRMSLARLIKFPKKQVKSSEDVAVVVRCDAFLKKNGKINSNMCYQDDSTHYPYVAAISRAAKKAVLNPGKVNGASRIVYFQYYVLFVKKDGVTSVEVIGNSGLELEKYGADYTSAQRYQDSAGKFGAGCGYNKKITVNAIISNTGEIGSIGVIGEDLGEKCVRYLEESFHAQRFIPAFYDGKAIPSFYSERIFNVVR